MNDERSERELIEEPELPLRDERGRFLRSGNPMGKPKGAITKFARLREDFFKAYRQMGGVQGLFNWAKEHQTEFYMMIFRLLPKDKEIPFSDQGPVLTYEEKLKLVVHGSVQGEQSRTDFEDVNDCEPNNEEEQDDGML
jgi:hypothetical protein